MSIVRDNLLSLAGLIEKLEKLQGPDGEVNGLIALELGWTYQKMKGDAKPYFRKPGVTAYYLRSSVPDFTGSLDAARTLVDGFYWLAGEGNDNGLMKPWIGRVWLNPPYGPPPVVGPWLRRMVEHNAGTVLIFARTETDLFFEMVWKRAAALLFFRGRLYFHHVDGTRAAANAGAPSVLIAYGERDAAILKDCGIAGQFVALSSQHDGSPKP